ncbi:protein CFAP20DC-like [Synchiropus picturatus]
MAVQWSVASCKLFENLYRGPGCIELFCARGNNPAKNWKLTGSSSAIRRDYNKDLRGLVYRLDAGSRMVKMQMPANEKMSLGIEQRFLVFQVNIPDEKDFSFELVVTGVDNIQRRLYFSTMRRQLCTSSLFNAQIPVMGIKRDVWSTLFFDLKSFSEVFTTKGRLTLNTITLHANCEVRRIFTMEPQAGISNLDFFLDETALMRMIPANYKYPKHISDEVQILDLGSCKRQLREQVLILQDKREPDDLRTTMKNQG